MRFYQSEETLKKILDIVSKKEKGAYLRFGDGDIVLATGGYSQDQTSHPLLIEELREALAINDKNVLKTLPLYCQKYGGFEKGMFPGNHESNEEWADNIYSLAKQYWGQEINEVYSHVALHFLASTNPDKAISFLKEMKRSFNNLIFIGNGQTDTNLLNILFNDNVVFVKTPVENSYDRINEIEHEVSTALAFPREYTLVVTAMGDAGRALQKRLWFKFDNIFLFDFGSLLCVLSNDIKGKNWRAWIDLSGIMKNRDSIIDALKI